VAGEPYLYEVYTDSESPVWSGRQRLAIMARADNGKVAAGYIEFDANTGELHDAFFAADCNEDCIGRVRQLIERGQLPYKIVERGVRGTDPREKIKLYDFGHYSTDGGIAHIKAYAMAYDGHVFMEVLSNGRSLGGTVAYSLKLELDRYKLAEKFAPYAKRLADLVGKDEARKIIGAVLKDLYPTEEKWIEQYLDAVFSRI